MVKNLIKEIGANSITSRETMYLFMYSTKTKNLSIMQEWGCCSSIRNTLDINFFSCNKSSSKVATHCIIKLHMRNIPNNFKGHVFLKKYLNFFNEIDNNYFNMVFLGENGIQDKHAPEEFRGIEFPHDNNNCYYIAFNMQNDSRLNTLNLAQLSWIRYLQFSRYWFYVNNIMKLRENEDLADLNNLEILQIASYGYNKCRQGDLIALWGYKSPITAEAYTYYIENDFKDILNRLNNGANLNSAFCSKIHAYSLGYIKKLFNEGEYVTIYNLLTDPVEKAMPVGRVMHVYATINNERGTWSVENFNENYPDKKYISCKKVK